MSYASIGRNDPSKDEVLNVYHAIREVAPETADIEAESVTVLKHYPMPLWYLWKSECDIIAKESIPILDGLLYEAEVYYDGQLSTKVDVFSFGVVSQICYFSSNHNKQ